MVVTHCGHGTTLKALTAGVPLVCLPMGRDQNDTAARVEHHGAGLRLRPTASAARIRRAVRRVLDDPEISQAAGRLAAVIEDERKQTDVGAELEALTHTAPRDRPIRSTNHPWEG